METPNLSGSDDLVEARRELAEESAASREQRMNELADAYWKAKQRGDAEEAKRIWDQMGAA